MIELKEISFSFKGTSSKKILNGITLNFPPGKISVILGASGCGKTTLLNLLAGLLKADTGEIVYSDDFYKRSVGYVFQNPSLIPWRTVWENIKLGSEIVGKKQSFNNQKATQLLEDYGLKDHKNAYPSELSGGMQQRVSIIRTIVAGSKILLLDEPFGNTDYFLRKELQNDLSELVKQENLIAILVTHNLTEAAIIGDQIVVLKDRPARVGMKFDIEIPRRDRLEMEFHEFAKYVEQIKEGFEKHGAAKL